MNEDGKFYSVVWICATLMFLTLTLTIGIVIRLNAKDFIKAGYTREALPGHSDPQWVRKP